MESKIKSNRNIIERIDLIDHYNDYGNVGYMDIIDFPNGGRLCFGTVTVPKPNDFEATIECTLPSRIFSKKMYSGYSFDIAQADRNASQMLQLYLYNCAIDIRNFSFYLSVCTHNESNITVNLPIRFMLYALS